MSGYLAQRYRLIDPLGYERVYLPLYKAEDTPFHIQRDEFVVVRNEALKIISEILMLWLRE